MCVLAPVTGSTMMVLPAATVREWHELHAPAPAGCGVVAESGGKPWQVVQPSGVPPPAIQSGVWLVPPWFSGPPWHQVLEQVVAAGWSHVAPERLALATGPN